MSYERTWQESLSIVHGKMGVYQLLPPPSVTGDGALSVHETNDIIHKHCISSCLTSTSNHVHTQVLHTALNTARNETQAIATGVAVRLTLSPRTMLAPGPLHLCLLVSCYTNKINFEEVILASHKPCCFYK